MAGDPATAIYFHQGYVAIIAAALVAEAAKSDFFIIFFVWFAVPASRVPALVPILVCMMLT